MTTVNMVKLAETLLNCRLNEVAFELEHFNRKVVLFNKAKGTKFHGKAFEMKQRTRSNWYRALDRKIAAEHNLACVKLSFLETQLENCK